MFPIYGRQKLLLCIETWPMWVCMCARTLVCFSLLCYALDTSQTRVYAYTYFTARFPCHHHHHHTLTYCQWSAVHAMTQHSPAQPYHTMELRFNRSDLGNLSTFYSNKGEKKKKKNSLKPKGKKTTTHETFLFDSVNFFSLLWFQAAFYLRKNCALIWYGIVTLFSHILIFILRSTVEIYAYRWCCSQWKYSLSIQRFFFCRLKNNIHWCFDFGFFLC